MAAVVAPSSSAIRLAKSAAANVASGESANVIAFANFSAVRVLKGWGSGPAPAAQTIRAQKA
jgi:hypothetical protein